MVERGRQLCSVSAVDGQGVAQEDTFVEFGGVTGVGDGRIAGDDDHSLALYINTGVVVPFVFGRHDSVAGKDDVGITDFDPLVRQIRPQDKVLSRRHRNARAASGDREGASRAGTVQRHLLHKAACRCARLEADAFDLRDDICDAFFLARSARQAAVVCVRGKFPDMAQQIAGRHRRGRCSQFG